MSLVPKDQIISLYKRFQRLDKSASGVLTPQELLNIPEFAMNPLAPRILSILFQSQNNRHTLPGTEQIDFLNFAHVIAHFSDSATQKNRLELALRIVDCDGDSKISHGDIYHILKLMVGDQVPDAELETISQTLYNELVIQARGALNDESNTNPLSKDEFFHILKNRPSLDLLNISLQ